MQVVYSISVEEGIDSFGESLVRYKISNSRIKEKISNMESFLQLLGNRTVHSVCKWKSLGQRLDKLGNPKDKDLKQAIYTDKGSNSKWTFSYTIDEVNDVLYVLQMKFSAHIIDTKQSGPFPFLTKLLRIISTSC